MRLNRQKIDLTLVEIVRFTKTYTSPGEVTRYVFTKSGQRKYSKGIPLEEMYEGKDYKIENIPFDYYQKELLGNGEE